MNAEPFTVAESVDTERVPLPTTVVVGYGVRLEFVGENWKAISKVG